MNLIVTGEIRSGKTTRCTKYSHWLLEQQFTVGRVLCPETRNYDVKIRYDIVDIQTGRSVLFGRFTSEANFLGAIVGNYRISYDGFGLAKRAIQNALENKCDMVFIDEVGHLELSRKGIIESTTMTCQKASNPAISVRKQLLTAFFEYYHLTEPYMVFDIKDLKLDCGYPLSERKTVT